MTSAVYHDRKALIQTNKQTNILTKILLAGTVLVQKKIESSAVTKLSSISALYASGTEINPLLSESGTISLGIFPSSADLRRKNVW